MLEQEARAILARLSRIRPFSLHETMVPAAALSPVAQVAIDRFLIEGRSELLREVNAFLRWLRGAAGTASPEEMQKRFMLIRLRFNTVLGHFDLFSDAITQRSETDNGLLLSGLEVAAAEGLMLRGRYYEEPPMICYLDRGPGGAIRRARTRLPGNRPNPVAIIRVPRERMVGHGVASSLYHEVGHQAAALLDLVASLSSAITAHAKTAPPSEQPAWALWKRWISEIIADVWSIGRVGITSTLGLMGVVSLPSVFVFRINTDDPHPTPWMRVILSCAVGEAMYPHPQWRQLAATWRELYPLEKITDVRRERIEGLLATLADLVQLILSHRPRSLRGAQLGAALSFPEDRSPEKLLALHRRWGGQLEAMAAASPSLVFGAFGQARLAGEISPEAETRQLTAAVGGWALRSTWDITQLSASGLTDAYRRPLPVGRRVPKPVPTH